MRSTQRIALLLLLVFFIPVVFFSVYQLSTLDEDEKMMEEIYTAQLEALLFSVNQYSDDVINNWIARVETGLYTGNHDTIPEKIQELLALNSSLIGVHVSDTIDNLVVPRSFSQESVRKNQLLQQSVTRALQSNPKKIQKLIEYKRNGFQKIEQLGDLSAGADSVAKGLFFISQQGWKFKVITLVIDPQAFIDDIIGPRLQTISRDQFVLSAIHKPNNAVVYSTATGADSLAQNAPVTRDFWMFPEYSIGIYSAGDGIEKLIAERTELNFLLLAGLLVVLVIALILVFRNLKKEVDLAQNKADFVSNVSHEIRTPLALISMFAETLEMNRVPSEEKKAEYYRILSKETQRLTRIVNKILNFSQAEAKKKKLHIERINMKPEIQGVLDIYDYHLRSKGFSYTFECQDPLWIRADRESLIECFINLLENAIKYSEDVKQISITGGKKDSWGYIALKDSGVGISVKDQKYIFDKFYRVPKGNLARAGGTGLGLAFVKQLTEEQKGKVSVQSEVGRGSTFTLYYPLD